METTPRISVVMPVWNGEEYLAAAMDSILVQTLTRFEFIVVDDGSTDGTSNILSSYRDPRLQVFRLDHAGIVAALNFGIAQARSAWIARQDADDISKPNRLEMQLAAVGWNPRAVLSFTDVEYIGEVVRNKGGRFPKSRAFLALKLCFLSPITHSTVMFSKAAFLEAGGYYPDERHAEDFSLWGRMLELGDFVGLSERLLSYRVHPLSVSKQNLETQVALTEKIAVRHCQRFMRLTDEDARRAHDVMRTPPRERRWSEWWWFLTRCVPRLRWKNAETRGWLLWQTVKTLF